MNQRLDDLLLDRVPSQPDKPLRAWDAADELVLDHLTEIVVGPDARVLVVNDSFGALSCALGHLAPLVINESAAGREATAKNLASNGLDPLPVQSMLDLGSDSLAGPFDVVVIKVPKSTSQLVDLLHRLRPLLHAETAVVGALMAKHLNRSIIEAFESIVGPTTTSLAKKKARLIHTSFDDALEVGSNPWPMEWEASGVRLVNFGGGFSAESLDIGTRALLDGVTDFSLLIPEDDVEEIVAVDLGSGNGIVGLRAAKDLQNRGDVVIEAIDDSALATAATAASWARSRDRIDDAVVRVHHHHRMVEVLDPQSAHLVVVNPPFHTDRVVGDHTAWSMFVDAHRVLRLGGALVVVGNRHLGYHAKLKKIFGAVETVSSSSKFVVLLARR